MSLYTTPLAQETLGAAIEVHATIGPGLLESMYQRALAHELRLRNLTFREQAPLPIVYKGIPLGIGYRVDFIIEGELVVELKTVERLLPIHDAQVLTYLNALGVRQGLLFNFNAARLIDGVRSLLNPRVGPNVVRNVVQE